MRRLPCCAAALGLLLFACTRTGPAGEQAARSIHQLAQPPTGSAERGAALFRNKGCAMCHLHGQIPESGVIEVGPNLTSYHNSEAFLRSWLADPAAVRLGTKMPDLDLAPDEIESLIAFLNAPPSGPEGRAPAAPAP